MTGYRGRISSLFGSIAGRTAVILILGLLSVAAASLLVAEQVWVRDVDRLRRIGMVDAVAGAITRLRERPAITVKSFDSGNQPNIRLAGENVPDGTPEAEATQLLEAKIGMVADVTHVGAPSCPRASQDRTRLQDCWYVRFQLRGAKRTLVADLPLIRVYRSPMIEPSYVLLLAAIGLALAIIVTRATIIPLRRLTHAAGQFSVSLDPKPIPEHGPREVRTALATFNLMQQRVRDGLRERTQILASVSHDLQTPLTRMRLRLEQVEDEALRERLLADLGVMQRLVGDGLDLAQSTETRETWSTVDLDSLLSSIAEDTAELGSPVAFVSGCGIRVKVRLAALSRALQNLIDNAVKHGGSAEIRCEARGGGVAVIVRDRGPGIAPESLETAFEAFTRLASSRSEGRDGTGLGLTIARAQAATFGATVNLANRPDGGLEATIAIPDHRDT